MYTVECSENFTINHTVKKEGEITYIDLTAQAIDAPGKLTLAVKWNYPLIGAHVTWSPIPYAVRGVTPTWGMDKTESNAMRSAPVRSYVAYDDKNGITVACSDAKNNVCIQMGLRESCACLACGVFIRVDCHIADYSARIRIDERRLPFSECIEDVAKWWETFDGYTPAPVPDAAKKPLYSTWYSYHQGITPEALLHECEYFHELGCDTIIVDDGWHTAVKGGVYSTCRQGRRVQHLRRLDSLGGKIPRYAGVCESGPRNRYEDYAVVHRSLYGGKYYVLRAFQG